jgi:hypothetical protein
MSLLEKFPRLKALKDAGAWTLITVGLVLFLLRFPLPNTWIINLPLAITIMQTAGLVFTIAGLQILVSKLVWPNISVSSLIQTIQGGNDSIASSLLMLGLLIYNGLTTIAVVIWLLYSLGLTAPVGG